MLNPQTLRLRFKENDGLEVVLDCLDDDGKLCSVVTPIAGNFRPPIDENWPYRLPGEHD